VLKVCQEYQQSANFNPSTCGDLWIQALTYFIDLPKSDCETYV